MRKPASFLLHQSPGYLAPMEYIEKQLAKIHSPVLPMWSASTPIKLLEDDNDILD